MDDAGDTVDAVNSTREVNMLVAFPDLACVGPSKAVGVVPRRVARFVMPATVQALAARNIEVYEVDAGNGTVWPYTGARRARFDLYAVCPVALADLFDTNVENVSVEEFLEEVMRRARVVRASPASLDPVWEDIVDRAFAVDRGHRRPTDA